MGVASALFRPVLCFPLLLCVAVQVCTHVVSTRTTVFPFGLNSICETNNFSITQIPRALQVARLFHLCELTALCTHQWARKETNTHTHTHTHTQYHAWLKNDCCWLMDCPFSRILNLKTLSQGSWSCSLLVCHHSDTRHQQAGVN